ncbi:MAG: SDR family NAD(P)-dependent oxidoreductase [Anaerolineales bacterium]|nr:SDR family NAD(P)-dependent oxidoreductase [Anaerolineales bacterium]
MSDLHGKVVLVTGAGRGLGRTLAKALAERGATVAANDLTPIHIDTLVEEIEAQGGTAKAYLADVSKKLALQTMLNEVLDDWGRVDMLVNHAEVEPDDALLDMDEWDWRRTLDVNLTGVFTVMQSVGRVMRAQGGGLIVNLLVENPRGAAYAASKGGLAALTRAAAEELASDSIRVELVTYRKGETQSGVEAVLELLVTGS